MSNDTFTKDPNAVLDYTWDWSAWLEVGETIAAATVTVSTGMVCDSSTFDTTTVTAWISGGTAGSGYKATCRVTTSRGRIDDRTIYLVCRER